LGRSKAPRARLAPIPSSNPSGQRGHPAAPHTWQGVEYRPLPAGSAEARRLFAYAGAGGPPESAGELGWGAWVTEPGGAAGDERSAIEPMVGALIVERSGACGLLHGPVVVVDSRPGA